MTKREELENPDSAWNRTADDEPVFVVCGRDVLAPATIRDWVFRANVAGVNASKINAAIELVRQVADYQTTHDTKLPD